MKNINISKKQWMAMLTAIVVGVVLGAAILLSKPASSEEPEHGASATHETSAKGTHGGKLFTKDGYAIEVTIFEQGEEPQFRIYTYQNGKPLNPAASKLYLTLTRLGRKPQEFAFTAEQDYFKGNAAVEEPHSFKVSIIAQHNNKSYQFNYEQVEERVAMSDQQLKQNALEIATVGPARIQSSLQLLGEIRLNEDRTVHVAPRILGVVESVQVYAGDSVRKGQLLAVIASQALADQRSELLAAQKRLTLLRATFAREKKLWEEKISAEQDYLQARHAMQELEITVHSAQQKLVAMGAGAASGNLTRYEIRAPIAGVITSKHIAVGEILKEDSNIFIIADLSTVWAELTVPAKDINQVAVGQKASIKATAFAAQSSGTVSYISALVGEQTRSAQARIVLANPKGVWRPGLPVEISLIAEDILVPLAISVDALQTVRDWNAVFGRYADQFEARPVELGRSDGKFIEVIKGLNAGEQYAAKNSFLIKAELGKTGASHDH